MYLKKVEIQGFKSFAEKTEVVFNDRITAIVGPNGSGKSNIADAIRWVLGEQSVKNLRGVKMEDIIFSGTEKRKALGFSEVTIVFDNASGKIPIDYREVAVTRRMFRSGESEYYINKNSCRLKDIRELFMDTGVGKEGYSIIGQGKIDEILSNKPEDRRNIFEEAAGIVKFKSKKLEATRKLERTQTNLTRIGDLLHEIKGQKESLQLEAEKAKEFQKLYGQLRKLDSNLSVYEITRMKDKMMEIETRNGSLLDEKIIVDREVIDIEDKYTSMKALIEELENIIEDKRNLKMESIQEFEKSKNRVRILEEREIHLKKEINRLKNEIQKSIDFLRHRDTNIDFKKKEIEKLEAEYSEISGIISDKTKERDSIQNILFQTEMNITDLKKSLMEAYSVLSDKKSEKNTIVSFKDSIDGRIALILDEIDGINEKLKVLAFEQKEKKIDYDEKLRKRDKMEKEIALHLSERDSYLDNLKSIEAKIQKNTADLENAQSSRDLYRNMEQEYEGYYNSVKAVVKAVKKDNTLGKGFIGTVADLFTVEKPYLKAIEVALGSSIQNIVVDDDSSAKRLINYLKNSKKGRATFLPLNTVNGNEIIISESDRKEFNIIGTGNRIISTKTEYGNIFRNLLGRTIVLTTMEDALGYSRKHGFKTRIVTLEGEIINPGGSMTGGSTNNQSISILNRKQTLNDLDLKINDLSVTIRESKSFFQSLQQKAEKSSLSFNRLNEDISIVVASLTNLEKDMGNLQYQIRLYEESIKSKSYEVEGLKEELRELNERDRSIDLIQDKLSNRHEDLVKEIEKIQSDYDEKRSIKEYLDNEITEFRIKLNSTDKNLVDYKDIIMENKNSIAVTMSEIKEKEDALLNLEAELDENLSEKEKLKEFIEKQTLVEEQEALHLKEKVHEKELVMKEFYQIQDRHRELTKRQTAVERELNKLEVDQAKYQIQIENILEKLENDYEMTLEDAEKLYSGIEDIRGTKRVIAEMKQGIKELGHVSLSAIEEYGNVLERYDFLNLQLVDLHGAKEDIESVVKDMEKKMRIQFKKSFEEINERFSETFAVLFNGGKARLEIEEENDILTAGIEIMAQPPGKKLQSLTLLSGGEKSLTAVALLFAILKTRPSPFCILDEIDAALDEANISRYTGYLNSLDDNTQFVLITHRKTTMEIADVLYGVTMEEEGVSRMISLKLKDYDEIAS